MIRFDNGPPDGDYVRYIDELMASRAASLVAPTMNASPNPVPPRALQLASPRGSQPASQAASQPASQPASHLTSQHALKPPSALSLAAASAIASAMMMSREARRPAWSISTIAIAAGAALILIGLFGDTANFVFIVAGVALVSWAIKRLAHRDRASG